MKMYTNDLDGFIKNMETISIESNDRSIIMMCEFAMKSARRFQENCELEEKVNREGGNVGNELENVFR